MGIIGDFFFLIGILILINFFFSLLYIFSKTVANGFYRWIVLDMDFLAILFYPIFGVTHSVANRMYDRFNWFVARLLLVLYAILLLILAVLSFILFGYIADRH
ncbi:hypothetical protein [Sutcliffiella sp. FSL R7-0096]|uniref:hypothetical protein n=1 Tax=Sutcliffiella sp. FSL R7-0096 TaxID=2921670 RepID=UPI00315A608D